MTKTVLSRIVSRPIIPKYKLPTLEEIMTKFSTNNNLNYPLSTYTSKKEGKIVVCWPDYSIGIFSANTNLDQFGLPNKDPFLPIDDERHDEKLTTYKFEGKIKGSHIELTAKVYSTSDQGRVCINPKTDRMRREITSKGSTRIVRYDHHPYWFLIPGKQ